MVDRPTITDLARASGVSISTVDRVLNGRARVREDTARRVYDAARQIGYHGAPLIHKRLEEALPHIRVGLVLHKERQAFYQHFRRAAEEAAAAMRGVRAEMRIVFSPSQSPDDFVAALDSMKGRVDVVGSTAVSHLSTTDAVIRLQNAGIPCFALLNDFAQGVRRGYIGSNNLKVGRIAANMMATSTGARGKIALFVGGYRWHGHELRETGFRSYMREYAPDCEVLDTLINLETRQLTYDATRDLLDRHPDLRGIYCAGGGMEGVITALREARAPRDVALVVNELTPDSRLALADRYVDMVVATPLETLCADLLDFSQRLKEDPETPIPGQHFLKPDLYLPESV